MMTATSFERESLFSDPLHGYIPYSSSRDSGEIAEQTLDVYISALSQLARLGSGPVRRIAETQQ